MLHSRPIGLDQNVQFLETDIFSVTFEATSLHVHINVKGLKGLDRCAQDGRQKFFSLLGDENIFKSQLL